MKGSYEIIWSEEALQGLADIINYIKNNFSDKDVNKFAVIFDEHINVIQHFPKSFPKSEKSGNIQRSIVAKLTSVYYSFDGRVIQIISVFDNRMNHKGFQDSTL